MDSGLFDVIPGVYGSEKMVEELFKVSLVESFGGGGILYVGLRLFQCPVDGLPVVEAFGEMDYLRAYKDVGAVDRSF